VVAISLYRALLWCYPAPFRDEYGSEMLAAFAAQLDDAKRHGGWWTAALVELQTITDLFLTAPKEHYHVTRLDIRHAFRTLASQPGFATVAVLSLALGIGANVAIFGLLNSVLFRALPVKDAKSLIMLTDPESSGFGNGSQGGERALLSYTEFEQLRDRTGVFSSLMACESELDQIEGRIDSAQAEELRPRLVSNNYFQTLGVRALVGRTLQPTDDLHAPYAVISYDLWQRRFGGRMEALGDKIAFHKGIFTVIGVMPASFFGETVGERPDVWLPLGMQPALLPGRDYLHDNPQDPSKEMWLHVFGRLKPGVTIQKAQAAANFVFKQDLQSFYSSRLSAKEAKTFMNQWLKLRPAATGASELRHQVSGPLKLLLAASALVLLIACANVGNLFLSRLTGRTRELAVRSALGASRPQLVRQIGTESLVIAALGGMASLLVAWVLRIGLLRLFGNGVWLSTSPDFHVLAFAFCVSVCAGVVLGLAPIIRTLKTEIVTGLREQGRGLTGSSLWLRTGRAIVAGQLALSLPLLVGAGLLLRTFYNLQQVNIGFEKDHVLTFDLDALSAGYAGAQQFRLFSDVLEQVRSIPGVHAATFSNNGFLSGNDSRDGIDVEGYVPKGKEDRHSRYEHVGPDFFSSLGIPIRLGREITSRDSRSSQRICVINEAFAKTFFAGRNPLGLHVTQKFGKDRNTLEVVGVVANSRQKDLRGEVEPRFYVPAEQPLFPLDSVVYEVRTAGAPLSVVAAVRKKVLSMNPELTMSEVRPLSTLIDQRITQDRILGRLTTGFGTVGLLLAAIGLYGVLSYAVGRRTGEIGIRKALGAPEQAVIAMIMRETGWLVAIGFGAGLILTIATVRLISSRLYGLAPTDPVALVSAIVVLAVVAFGAAWLPSYRAARIDPLVALRYE
jgi:predicted permease